MAGVAKEIKHWKIECGACSAAQDFFGLSDARSAGWQIEWPNQGERVHVRCPNCGGKK